jgi:hypothetical protein
MRACGGRGVSCVGGERGGGYLYAAGAGRGESVGESEAAREEVVARAVVGRSDPWVKEESGFIFFLFSPSRFLFGLAARGFLHLEPGPEG